MLYFTAICYPFYCSLLSFLLQSVILFNAVCYPFTAACYPFYCSLLSFLLQPVSLFTAVCYLFTVVCYPFYCSLLSFLLQSVTLFTADCYPFLLQSVILFTAVCYPFYCSLLSFHCKSITAMKSLPFCRTTFSSSLTNITALLHQSRDSSCYVIKPTLTLLPLWLHKHSDLLAQKFVHSQEWSHNFGS